MSGAVMVSVVDSQSAATIGTTLLLATNATPRYTTSRPDDIESLLPPQAIWEEIQNELGGNITAVGNVLLQNAETIYQSTGYRPCDQGQQNLQRDLVNPLNLDSFYYNGYRTASGRVWLVENIEGYGIRFTIFVDRLRRSITFAYSVEQLEHFLSKVKSAPQSSTHNVRLASARQRRQPIQYSLGVGQDLSATELSLDQRAFSAIPIISYPSAMGGFRAYGLGCDRCYATNRVCDVDERPDSSPDHCLPCAQMSLMCTWTGAINELKAKFASTLGVPTDQALQGDLSTSHQQTIGGNKAASGSTVHSGPVSVTSFSNFQSPQATDIGEDMDLDEALDLDNDEDLDDSPNDDTGSTEQSKRTMMTHGLLTPMPHNLHPDVPLLDVLRHHPSDVRGAWLLWAHDTYEDINSFRQFATTPEIRRSRALGAFLAAQILEFHPSGFGGCTWTNTAEGRQALMRILRQGKYKAEQHEKRHENRAVA